MAVKGLREWIATLEGAGELKRITAQVDWNLELAEIARRSHGGPALLFENIKDHRHTLSTRLFINGLSSFPRMCMMLGLQKDTRYPDLIKAIRDRMKNPVQPEIRQTGAVKEHIIRGDQVDLLQFPVPKWHPLDGGRYIDTFSGTVTRDPDTGEMNFGVYRGMVAGKDKISKLLQPHQHWGLHYQKYQRLQREMPVAVVHGADDILPFVGGSAFSHPPDEYAIAGGLKQAPLALVKCETNDLLVPADAEFVVEGRLSTDEASFMTEGPFGEFTGYYGWSRKRPVIQVDCITHRSDPIFRGNVEGAGEGVVSESVFMGNASLSALVWDHLEKAGVPGVLDLRMRPGPLTVKIRKMYAGHGRQVGAAIFGSWLSKEFLKWVIVVDEDIDIRDMNEINRAIRDRMDPKDDIVIFPAMGGCTLDLASPSELKDEMKYGATPQNKMLFDATIDWVKHPVREEYGGRRFPPLSTETLPEIKDLVTRRWKEYGF
ncbi:MAG: UbiD family decarboxylase [Desulfobacterales bacterium]|nr:UbiD family decarboxylase [Desulfobacterales bacterium]